MLFHLSVRRHRPLNSSSVRVSKFGPPLYPQTLLIRLVHGESGAVAASSLKKDSWKNTYTKGANRQNSVVGSVPRNRSEPGE